MPAGSEKIARAPMALAFVLVALAPRVSAADVDLTGLPPEQATLVRAKLDALTAAGVASDRVVQKLREGRAKKVPAARIAQVVVRLADSLLWAAERLEGCEQRGRLVELAADLVFDAAPRDQVAPALKSLCRDEAAAEKLSDAAGLYSFLTHKLSASPGSAWAFAFELLKRDEAEGAVNRLIPVLQDVYRNKRSIDRPLDIAVTRLRAGASLRTVRNELRDQFLRR